MNDFSMRKLVAGAVSGFLAAAVVDVSAWARSMEPFDWSLAAKRWVAGAVSGVCAAMGIAAVPGGE